MMKPESDKLRAQLSKIIDSKDFEAPERLKAFLSFIVEEAIAGRAEALKAYTIAVSVFGRSSEFDPVADPIVRVEAGKLRKALERYYLANPDDPVIIKMPVGTYIPLISWNENGVERQAGFYESGKRRLSELETVMQKQLHPGVPTLKQEIRPILLVLPFINEDESLKPFVYGLTEDLIMEINQAELVDVLMAAPGTSLEKMLEDNRTGARFVLQGHIQSTETLLRVYISLTDANDGKRLWTDKFDNPGKGEELIEFQEQISLRTSSMLVDNWGVIVRLLMNEVKYIPPGEAGSYEAPLYYKIWESTLDKSDYSNAMKALEHSLKFDPNNPEILAELSRLYASDYQFAYNNIPGNLDISMDLAKLAARHATCPIGHLALVHNLFVQRRKQPLEEALKIVMGHESLTPYVQSTVGFFTAMAFDLEEGKKLVEKAAALNPHRPGYTRIVSFLYHFTSGGYESALKETLLLHIPANVWDPILRVMVYSKLGVEEAVEEAFKAIKTIEPDFKQKRSQIIRSMMFDDEYVGLVEAALEQGVE